MKKQPYFVIIITPYGHERVIMIIFPFGLVHCCIFGSCQNEIHVATTSWHFSTKVIDRHFDIGCCLGKILENIPDIINVTG
jgi:hypothetical protein